MSKKVVLAIDLYGDKDKQKAMIAVSSLPGVESVAVNMKDKKLTVIGDIDPVQMVAKLRKDWHTEIVTVGPAKEPEKNKVNKDRDVNRAGRPVPSQSTKENPNPPHRTTREMSTGLTRSDPSYPASARQGKPQSAPSRRP